jgi:hypothetical protein
MRNPTPENDSAATEREFNAPQKPAPDGHHSSATINVQVIRPDGSTRDIRIAGHFREEHLCSVVDEELCRLESHQNLIVHIYHTNAEFADSLRSRWREGLTDNRRVFVREVLGPSDSLRDLDQQLDDINRRISLGEKVNLAIRSPIVAVAARERLRKLLLSDQQLDGSRLNVWVFGSEEKQQEILEHLGSAGMVRARDSSKFVEQHPEQRWRMPWVQQEHRRHPPEPPQPHIKHIRTPQEAVAEWIRRVEESRELSEEHSGEKD